MTTSTERSATGAEPGPGAQQSAREVWIDNLRVVLIMGVIGAHVATAYVIDIDWYYMERTASAVSEAVFGAVFGTGLLFGMGLLFLVAGLFTPRAFLRKGAKRFARDRLIRLGIPLVAFVLVVDPLTDFIGFRAMGGTDGFVAYLGRWISDDADLGPAWFVAALLAFSLAYAAWRTWRPAPPARAEALGRRQLLLLGVFIAIGSYLVRIPWPLASNAWFGLNLWEFPQMVGLFTLGVLADERAWLDGGLPDRLWRGCGQTAIAGGGILLLVVAAVQRHGDAEPFLGGAHPEAIGIPIAEAVIAIGMSLWTLEWFRRRWDRGGSCARALGRASFAAYLVHPPVIVGLAVALSSVPIPVEVKFFVVFAGGVGGSFGVGWLATRWPVVARVV